MITVIWLSESQSIPKYGIAETGKEITLPKEKAESFIARKMAELPQTKKKTAAESKAEPAADNQEAE